jgi:hypothetical protein
MSASINYVGPYVFDARPGPGPDEARITVIDDRGNAVHLFFDSPAEATALVRAALEAEAILDAISKGEGTS